MRNLVHSLIAPAILWLVLAGTAMAQDTPGRVALVIGNADYSHVARLDNPANDASDIAAALTRIGFDVTLMRDLDDSAMRRALRDFGVASAGSDVALIYYAGHGVQIDNTNYMIPVNAELKRDVDVTFEAIRLETVLASVGGARGLKVVFVDACRDNPFLNQMTRTVATRSLFRGLSKIEPDGVVVGFAAKDGTSAFDGDGRNSPYAAALLAHLEEPGLELGKFFRKVRDAVLRTTGGVQEPFFYGSLPAEDIFLVKPQPAVAIRPPAQTGQGSMAITAAFAEASRTGTLSGWTDFLEAHGQTTSNPLVALAVARRDALQAEADEEKRRAEMEARVWLKAPAGPDGDLQLDTGQRRLVQEALNMAGFDTGGVDGQFGPKTRRAVAEARLKLKLPVTENVAADLIAALPNAVVANALQSQKARVLRVDDLPDGLDPRLIRALKFLSYQPVRFGYFGGHLYIAVLQDTHWTRAKALAERAGGHLVTISSAAENRFVYDLFATDPRFVREHEKNDLSGPFIGLYQEPGSSEPRGGWVWVTGEPVSYTNWERGEPNNHRGNQNFAAFHRGWGNVNRISRPVVWDDQTGGGNPGYIIEIE